MLICNSKIDSNLKFDSNFSWFSSLCVFDSNLCRFWSKFSLFPKKSPTTLQSFNRIKFHHSLTACLKFLKLKAASSLTNGMFWGWRVSKPFLRPRKQILILTNPHDCQSYIFYHFPSHPHEYYTFLRLKAKLRVNIFMINIRTWGMDEMKSL